MTYTCIGKHRDNHGHMVECTNTSETPTNPARPEWGYLCSDCANARPNGRPSFLPEQIDLDKPNAREFEPCELPQGHITTRIDETEAEEMDKLEELDLG